MFRWAFRWPLPRLDAADSKHLKWRDGAPPSELECKTQGQPLKQVAMYRTSFTGDELIATIVLRSASRRDLPSSIPRALPEGRSAAIDPTSTFLRMGPKRMVNSRSTKYDVIVHSLGNRMPASVATSMWTAPTGLKIVTVRSPVARFIDVWNHFGVTSQLQLATGKEVTMRQ